jgi:hypothetical protein
MPIQDLWHDIGVVEELNDVWLSKPVLFPRRLPEDVQAGSAHWRALLRKAREAFGDERTERKECEEYVTEVLQFRHALAQTHAENPQLRDQPGYAHAYYASISALKHIVSTVRLYFLLLDLQARVADG